MVTTLERPAPEQITLETRTNRRPIDRSARRYLDRRLIGRAFLAVGLAEGVWVALLSFTLPALARAQHWSAGWAALDTVEALALFCTGWLFMRRDGRCIFTAVAAAGFLLVDAWIDVATSATGTQHTVALVQACLAELPAAIGCGLLALYVVRQRPRSRAVRPWLTPPAHRPAH